MTRYDIAFKALESHEIESDTLGQLGAHNFTDKAILMAVERHWISVEFAARLLDAEVEDEDDIEAGTETSVDKKMIKAKLDSCTSKISYYKSSIQSNIEDIQKAAAHLTPDNCSEASSIQTYAQRIAEAKAHIEELNEIVISLEFMLAR